MSLFPFLIVVAALGGFVGSRDLADEAARILLEAWPQEVAKPIAENIHSVLTSARKDVLTLGLAFSVYFASSGVESLRIALNRSYAVIDRRNWLLLRLESILYVLDRRRLAARLCLSGGVGAADLVGDGTLCTGASRRSAAS